MGSVGVSSVAAPEQLAAAIERLDGSAPFLIETFVPGPEFSAEGVFRDGVPMVLALTAKRTAAGFVEAGHRMPAALDPDVAALARAEVQRALTAVGLTCGIFHVELWLSPDGVVLGEIHARPGGDFLHAMVEHTRPGLELYGMLIDDLLGAPPAPVPAQCTAAAAEFLLLPSGIVQAVHGWAAVQADEAVIAADLSIRPADRIGAVSSSADRHGVLVVGGKSGAEVEATVERLLSTLCVEIS
jgi:biotin carboxylase